MYDREDFFFFEPSLLELKNFMDSSKKCIQNTNMSICNNNLNKKLFKKLTKQLPFLLEAMHALGVRYASCRG